MFAQLVSGSIDWCVLGSFVVYLVLMLGIGFLFSNRQENMGDYFLGGRKMNKWVVALSAQASDMSGWLLMGLPGAIFLGGFSEAWIGIGLAIGTYLNWKIVAHRLRRYSQICGDSITIPDFIANRFRDKTGVSRVVAALIILVFFTFYTASGFVSAAKDGRSGTALLFRERSAKTSFALDLAPYLKAERVEVLAGRGTAALAGNVLTVDVPAPLDFIWVRLGE